MDLEVGGARGSVAVDGPAYVRYGGATTCFSIELPGGHRVIVDGGTGLHRLEGELRNGPPLDATMLITHFHWDHIEGLPLFAPLFDAHTRLRFIAAPPVGHTIEGALGAVIQPPWFPVSLQDCAAQLSYEPLSESPFHIGPLQVTAAPLTHPGGVTGYRIEHGGGSIVIATDVEAENADASEAVCRLAAGASVLVHDAQYLEDEYASRRGWGHSTWRHAAENARTAGVGRLVLTSHDPWRSDEAIDAIVAETRQIFAATEAAYPGQRIAFA